MSIKTVEILAAAIIIVVCVGFNIIATSRPLQQYSRGWHRVLVMTAVAISVACMATATGILLWRLS